MKALKFGLAIFLTAVGALIISQGIGGITLASSAGDTPDRILSAEPIADPNKPSVADGQLLPPAASLSLSTPNDPEVDKQWALSHIRAWGLWQTKQTQRVLVAVLDTGIDQNHEDLRGVVVGEVNFTDSPTASDVNGHGTHVAGTIAANRDNGAGIVGLAPDTQLLNVKVADDKGRCTARAIARGIIWAADNEANVINISLEIREPSSELAEAVDYAWSRGAIVISAAGNDGSHLPVYPAYYENSIAVAGTRQDDSLAPLSNYGDWVDVAAPGFNIYSTLPGNRYGYKTGTSFAAAYVSGLATILFNAVTDNNGDGRLNDEVRAAIEGGCQETVANDVGKGRIDAPASLSAVSHAT